MMQTSVEGYREEQRLLWRRLIQFAVLLVAGLFLAILVTVFVPGLSDTAHAQGGPAVSQPSTAISGGFGPAVSQPSTAISGSFGPAVSQPSTAISGRFRPAVSQPSAEI